MTTSNKKNKSKDARWNGQIIGQGGPTNAQFTNLWTQLASKYGTNDKVIFGLMNEPHDVPDIDKWAATVQEVVTAIRAVAKTNKIALPGNECVFSLLPYPATLPPFLQSFLISLPHPFSKPPNTTRPHPESIATKKKKRKKPN